MALRAVSAAAAAAATRCRDSPSSLAAFSRFARRTVASRAEEDRDAVVDAPTTSLLGMSEEALTRLAREMGEPGYRGKQMHDSIYGMRKARVVDMALLPGAFREKLVRAGMEIGRVAPADVVSSPDGTKKILLELRCGSVIEAVGIPGDVPGDAASGDGPRRRRFTACVSSQVGCAMRCSFCATGRQGYKRNLDAAEMVNQVMALEDVFQRRATNVVMMGMGEPLMNLGNVLEAHRCLNADVGIGGRYFTISTVGVPNAIAKLAAHKLQATLAVSLHAPDQALRERLIPSAKAYPLDALLRDCRAYKKVTGRRVTFEYTLLAGENDSVEHAEALAALLRRNVGGGCHVNLLPWNPVRGAEETHARPSANATRRFAEALEREKGITLTVRKTRGLEADAACGQLTGSFVRKRRVSGEPPLR